MKPPPIAVTLACALALYAVFWPIAMQDVGNDYVPWLRHIARTGPLAAFETPFASYNPPYLYLLALVSPLYGVLAPVTLIKLISLGGTAALALAVFRLLRARRVDHAGRWAAMVMVLPTTVANAALLGQCDAWWAAPCVAALAAALDRRHKAMLLWCGAALAFKMQAVLFAPFVAAVLINRRVPVTQWLIVPAVFLASLVPAWALGWAAASLIGIYGNQAQSFPLLSLNAPNIWFIVQTIVPTAAATLTGVALAIAVAASACYVACCAARLPGGNGIVVAALLCLLMTAGLLPHMHERYFFLADIVALIWAFVAGGGRAWGTALLVQAGSALAVSGYVFGQPWLVELGFAPMAVATALAASALPRLATEDHPLLARLQGAGRGPVTDPR